MKETYFVSLGIARDTGGVIPNVETVRAMNITKPSSLEEAVDLEEEIRAVIYEHFERQRRLSYFRRLDAKCEKFSGMVQR